MRSRNATTLSHTAQTRSVAPKASGTESQAGAQRGAAGQGTSGGSGGGQGASGQGTTTGGSGKSLTDEIVSRLNPFASTGKGGRR